MEGKNESQMSIYFFRTLIFLVTAVVENQASWTCIYEDNSELYL